MKKLFISVPMRGRTDENIMKSIEGMHAVAEIVFGEKLEPVYNLEEIDIPVNIAESKRSMYCLGAAIQKMAECDYFIGTHYDWKNPGCYVENNVAGDYGLETFFIDHPDCWFFNDIPCGDYED